MTNLDKLMDETLQTLSKGQSVRKGEYKVKEYSNAKLTFDGMKLARELALLSFYNATCELIPKSKLRKAFTEFYNDLDQKIIHIGDSGNFDDEKDALFGAMINLLKRLDIPKEKWKEFI